MIVNVLCVVPTVPSVHLQCVIVVFHVCGRTHSLLHGCNVNTYLALQMIFFGFSLTVKAAPHECMKVKRGFIEKKLYHLAPLSQ